MKTTVVNVRTDPCDVYIGRPSPFGNPFIIGRDGDRTAVIAKFTTWFERELRNNSWFRDQVLNLRGKRLGCYCAPAACHGDVIAQYLNTYWCTVCEVATVDAENGFDTCARCLKEV